MAAGARIHIPSQPVEVPPALPYLGLSGVDRVPLDPTTARLGRAAIVGEPFNDKVIGATSIDWGHGPNDYGRVAFITTDGGTVQLPPDGVLRKAKLVRIEIAH